MSGMGEIACAHDSQVTEIVIPNSDRRLNPQFHR